MNKMKIGSRKQVFQKYGANIEVAYKDSNGKDRTAKFELRNSLSRINKFATESADPFETFYYNLRTKDKLGSLCRLCSSDINVEMHHVRALKSGKTSNTFMDVMRQINRKQIPVCKSCHIKIHAGKYDGLSLKKILSNNLLEDRN